MKHYGYEQEDNKSTDWNMNNAWLMEIMNMLSKAHEYRAMKDNPDTLESFWDCLRSIWHMMSYDLDQLFWSKKDSAGNDDMVNRCIEMVLKVEADFAKANNMFIHKQRNVPGAEGAALQILDEIESKIDFLMGAMKYYKLRTDIPDARYSD